MPDSLIAIIKNPELKDEEKIKLLSSNLELGASLDETDEKLKESVLHCAVMHGGLELFQWLISKKPDLLLAKTSNGANVLFYAVAYSKEEILRSLLLTDIGCVFFKEAINEDSSIIHLGARKSLECFELLTTFADSLSLEWNIPNKEGIYPIHAAVRRNNWKIIEFLLSKKISIDLPTQDGNTPCHLAASLGYSDLCQRLIETGANYNQPNKNGVYPIHFAAGQGHRTIVEYLLSKKVAIDIPQANEWRWTCLQNALLGGQLELFQWLVEQGADCNNPFGKGWYPIHIAAEKGYWSVIQFLLSKGIPVDMPLNNESRSTPFDIALSHGHFEVCKHLMEQGANYHHPTKIGKYLIHAAAEKGDLSTIRYLLSRAVPVDLAGNNEIGATALHIAAFHGYFEVCKLLIEQGADYHRPSLNGVYPIHMAADKGHWSIVEYLLSKGVDIDLPRDNEWGSTAFHQAALNGNLEFCQKLVQLGADYNRPNKKGAYAIHMATDKGHLPIIKYLLSKGVSVDLPKNDVWGSTPFHLAIINGNLELCQQLAQEGADINRRNKRDVYPIHMAADKNNWSIIEYLLSEGVAIDLETKDTLASTAFRIAVEKGYTELCIQLIQKGAIFDLSDKLGWHPIHVAARTNHFPIIQLLLSKGIFVDLPAKNESQITPFQLAIEFGHLETCEQLVKHGANYRCPTNKGFYPIHIAAEQGRENMIKYLLSLQSSAMYQLNSDGKTALHIAIESGHYECVKFLLEKGGFIWWHTTLGNPLTLAILYGHTEIIKLLFKFESEMVNSFQKLNFSFSPLIEQATSDGWFPLHFLSAFLLESEYKYDKEIKKTAEIASEIFDELISHGQDVNQTTFLKSDTLLHCLFKDLEKDSMLKTLAAIDLFIDKTINGLNIKQINSDHNTALHQFFSINCNLVTSSSGISIAKKLISAGFSLTSKNSLGQTPLDNLFQGDQVQLTGLNELFREFKKMGMNIDDSDIVTSSVLDKYIKDKFLLCRDFVLENFPSRYYLFLSRLSQEKQPAPTDFYYGYAIKRDLTKECNIDEKRQCSEYFLSLGAKIKRYKKNTDHYKNIFSKAIRSSKQVVVEGSLPNENLDHLIKICGALLLSPQSYIETIFDQVFKTFVRLLQWVLDRSVANKMEYKNALNAIEIVLENSSNSLHEENKKKLEEIERRFLKLNKPIPSLLELCVKYFLRNGDISVLEEDLDNNFSIIEAINRTRKNNKISTRFYFWKFLNKNQGTWDQIVDNKANKLQELTSSQQALNDCSDLDEGELTEKIKRPRISS